MMAVSQEDLAFLQDALPFWNGLDKHAQEKLAGAVTRRSYRKGELLHQGRECLGVMVLRSGQVRTFLVSQSGKEVTLYRSFERDVCLFSASCIIRSIQFEVIIEAEKDTELWVIPPDIYKRVMEDPFQCLQVYYTPAEANVNNFFSTRRVRVLIIFFSCFLSIIYVIIS